MKTIGVRLLVLSALVACSHDVPPENGEVVARFRDGVITSSEMDARILDLPARERPGPGADLETWFTEQVQEVFVERVLLQEARAAGLDAEDAFLAARSEAEKTFVRRLCLAAPFQEARNISEDEIEAAFVERAEGLRAPERRSVSQIFLRASPDAESRIQRLRDRVLAGEVFAQLAREHSESESRHADGSLDWLVPGTLPPAFDRIVFTLDEGVPSEPVVTSEGVHVFLVDRILPARALTLDEARPALRTALENERREAFLSEIDARVATPLGSLVPTREQLAEALAAGDPATEILRVGSLRWTLGDLLRVSRNVSQGENAPAWSDPVELAWRVLDNARRAEEVYLDCLESPTVSADVLEERLAAWEAPALVDAQRRRRLFRLAEADDEQLRSFYRGNVGEFSSAPTWTVRRLRIPLTDNAKSAMARLEAGAREQSSLETLQSEIGGEIEDLGSRPLGELSRIEPKLAKLVAPLRPGSTTAPYRTRETIEIARVEARSAPRPRDFEEVRHQVAERFVRQYRSDLYSRLRSEILEAEEFRVDPQGLATLWETGLPDPAISVEQLDELLETS